MIYLQNRRLAFSGGAASLPMDAYSNRVGMYSIARQLVTGATYAIRVRRSSDNSEQDIGFSGGELDQSALTTFVGGGNDGFITTIYEQDGGTSITQSTSTAQPRVVISGTVVTSGGKPAADFDGSSDWMDVSDTLFDISSATTYTVAQSDTTSGNHIVLASGGSLKWYFPLHSSTNHRFDVGVSSFGNFAGADTGIRQYSMWSSSTQAACYVDGAQKGTTISEATTGTLSAASLGGFNESSGTGWDGKISELLVFSTPHNSGSTRADIEADQSTFYGTP